MAGTGEGKPVKQIAATEIFRCTYEDTGGKCLRSFASNQALLMHRRRAHGIENGEVRKKPDPSALDKALVGRAHNRAEQSVLRQINQLDSRWDKMPDPPMNGGFPVTQHTTMFVAPTPLEALANIISSVERDSDGEMIDTTFEFVHDGRRYLLKVTTL